MELSPQRIADFSRDGYTILPDFYDLDKHIHPIQDDIRSIIALLCKKYNVDAATDTFEQAVNEGYLTLAKTNRAWGGEVYDAVKQIPGFLQLVSNPRNAELFENLRPGSRAGIAAGGYGIRIDAPHEAKFRAPWHQEFPAQLRSIDGLVFWSPLVPIQREMGPVEIAVGSHSEGLVPVYEDDQGVGKTGAYALRLDQEEARLAKYPKIAPLSKPGDLIIMDFLTLHQSGLNVSDQPRWTMQFRYFNFLHPTASQLSWRGAFAEGQDLSSIKALLGSL